MLRPVLPSLSFFRCVQTCLRVEFHHRKNGLPSFFASVMKRCACTVTSSSIVSMRFLPSGPVLTILCYFCFTNSTSKVCRCTA
jgi:hypothetical protein